MDVVSVDMQLCMDALSFRVFIHYDFDPVCLFRSFPAFKYQHSSCKVLQQCKSIEEFEQQSLTKAL